MRHSPKALGSLTLCCALFGFLGACSDAPSDGDVATEPEAALGVDGESATPDADEGIALASGARVTSKPEGLFNRNGSMESGTAFSCVYDVTDASFTMGPEDLHYASVEIEMRAGDNGCLPFEAEQGRPQVIKLTTTAKTGVGITSPRDGFATTKLLTTAFIDGVEAEFEMSCVMDRSDEAHDMQCNGGMPVSQWLPDDNFGDEQLRFSTGVTFVR